MRIITLLAFLTSALPAQQVGAPDEEEELGELSLEELMDVEITSAAKKEQKVSDAMGAIYVVTAEDIRRSGMTSIPDILRMVPGIQVARINGSSYAISARGFASQFSNKLLVLIDGRSIYTPLHSGVYWDARDVMLEDVLRIEVIRGPGGALWGANAVNGVINIITKPSSETQGGIAYAGSGNEERILGGGRFGFEIDEETTGRVYAKYFTRDGQVNSAGLDQKDDWRQARAGFRFDRTLEAGTLTLQGDYYEGRTNTVNNLPQTAAPFIAQQTLRSTLSGGNITGRWRTKDTAGSDSVAQFYYDAVARDGGIASQLRQTADFEYQWRQEIDERFEIMTGLGVRLIQDEIGGSPFTTVNPEKEQDTVFSGFLRGEYDLVEDTLTVALGAKLEHNDYTGFELQPDLRLRWNPQSDHTVWVAYSRAVRVPGRAEIDLRTPVRSMPGGGGMALQTELVPNPSLDREVVVATELGYRIQADERLSFDLTGFYNKYDDLIAPRIAGAPYVDSSGPRIVQPIALGNTQHGETFGAELAAQWGISESATLSGGYSFMKTQLHSHDPAQLPDWQDREESHPENQAHLRINVNLGNHIELDSALFYVDSVRNYNIPSYLRWDARFGWSPTANTDVSLVLQNLLDSQHPEFGSNYYQQPTETERSIFFKVTTRF